MNTTQHGFMVRAQGPGRLSCTGEKRPVSRQDAWDAVKRYQQDGGFDMIEVVNLTVDKVVFIASIQSGAWKNHN